MTKRVSLELETLDSLEKLEVTQNRKIIVEAEVGEIRNVSFIDSAVLEIIFEQGVIRLDMMNGNPMQRNSNKPDPLSESLGKLFKGG